VNYVAGRVVDDGSLTGLSERLGIYMYFEYKNIHKINNFSFSNSRPYMVTVFTGVIKIKVSISKTKN